MIQKVFAPENDSPQPGHEHIGPAATMRTATNGSMKMSGCIFSGGAAKSLIRTCNMHLGLYQKMGLTPKYGQFPLGVPSRRPPKGSLKTNTHTLGICHKHEFQGPSKQAWVERRPGPLHDLSFAIGGFRGKCFMDVDRNS